MKKCYKLILLSVCIVLFTNVSLRAQTSSDWLSHLTIAQSMATTDQQALPAQFNVTFPKNQGAAFLINLGAKYDFASFSDGSVLSATAEYHRNSMVDSVQNNLQLGFSYSWRFAHSANGNNTYFLIVDPLYSWDGVAKTNNAETELLLTTKSILGDHLNLGRPTHWKNKAVTFFLSGYAGMQVQQVFPSDTTMPKGFKLRPVVKALASYAWNRHVDKSQAYNPNDPIIKIFIDYDLRKTIVNTTADGENFTHLLNTGVNYYFMTKPAQVSFGLSFVEGADYFSGMKAQQYFLATLNIALQPSAQ